MTIPSQLIEYVRSTQAVLILCASADGESDSKASNEIGPQIADHFLDASYRNRSVPDLIDLATSEVGVEAVQQFIASKYLSAQPSGIFNKIPHFRWITIASTHIDLRLERAYAQRGALQTLKTITRDTDDVDTLQNGFDSVLHLKLHGCVSQAGDAKNPLILDPGQYPTHLSHRGHLFERLVDISAEYPAIIIGRSPSSPDVRAILRYIASGPEARPRSFLVVESTSPADDRLLDSRKVSVVPSPALALFTALETEVTKQQRALGKLVRHDDLPIRRRFTSNVRRPTDSLLAFLAADVEYLYPGQPTEVPSPREFYRGHLENWAPIEHRLDIERTISETILPKILEEDERSLTQTFHLLRGHSGAGKTVVLRRLAWDTAMEWNRLCLYVRSSGILDVDPILELYDLCKQRIFLFVDQVTNHVDALLRLITRLRRDRVPITVVGTERHHAWNMLAAKLETLVTDPYELRYLNEPEVDRLIDKLAEHNSLGYLEGRPRKEQQDELAKRAGRQLLVALHEATLGRPFAEIVLDEYTSISSDEARSLYLTVCVLHRLGVKTRAGLVSRVHGVPFHQFRTDFMAPLESIVFARGRDNQYDYYYETRHPHIAEIVFEGVLTDAKARFEKYLRILEALDAGYEADREALKYILHAKELRRLFSDATLVRAIFDLGCKRYPEDPHILQQRAIYEMSSEQGSLDAAQSALQAARKVAPHNPLLRHSEAELLIRRAADAARPAEKQRFRTEARRILTTDSSEKTSYSRHSLLKIDLAELRDLIAEGDEDRVTQKTNSIERSIAEALFRAPFDEYILQGEAAFSELVANEPRALNALKRAFASNKHSPYVATRLAKTLARAGDVNQAKRTLEEYLDGAPHDREVHFQLAKLLIDNDSSRTTEILHHLRSSFTTGDSRLEAQFWYARALYLEGQITEAHELFEKLSSAEVSTQERLRPRGTLRAVRHSGRIVRIDGNYAWLKRDVTDDTIYMNALGSHLLQVRRAKAGQRVTFGLAFNLKGPIAIDVASEGDSSGQLETPPLDCDIGIVVALKEEFRILMAAVGERYVSYKDRETACTYYRFELPDGVPDAKTCVAVMIGEMGPEKAVLYAERLISTCRPDLLVVVGIAASLNADIRIGDLCLARQVDLYIESAKAEPAGQAADTSRVDTNREDFVLKPGGSAYRTSRSIVDEMSNLEFAESRVFSAWRQRCNERWDKVATPEIRAKLIDGGMVRQAPVLEECVLASAGVVGASEAFKRWLLRRERNYKALDMESAGAMIAASERADPVRTLILRGVSDYGDERKKEVDSIGHGGLRAYAMQNAVDLIFSLIENGVLDGALR